MIDEKILISKAKEGDKKAFEEIIGDKVIVSKNSHLMGAFGIALMARDSEHENVFNFDVDNLRVDTRIASCGKCSNNCEIVTVYKNEELIDCWGNRCDRGKMVKNV